MEEKGAAPVPAPDRYETMKGKYIRIDYKDDGSHQEFYKKCPVCGETGRPVCRCQYGEDKCKNGHLWHHHWMIKDKVLAQVVGNSKCDEDTTTKCPACQLTLAIKSKQPTPGQQRRQKLIDDLLSRVRYAIPPFIVDGMRERVVYVCDGCVSHLERLIGETGHYVDRYDGLVPENDLLSWMYILDSCTAYAYFDGFDCETPRGLLPRPKLRSRAGK